MTFLKKSFIILSLTYFVTDASLAQPEAQVIKLPDLPQFYFDALGFASDQAGLGRLDLYVEVPFESIHFIKENDLFHASYEISVNIYDTTETLINEKWWNEKVETKNYDESISPKVGNLSQKSFPLSPGSYNITIQIKDNETSKISRGKRRVLVRDFSVLPFSISDIMLVNRMADEVEKKVVYPNISGNVGDLSDSFFLFFETYNHLGADSARVQVRIRNVKGVVVQSDTFYQPLVAEKKSCFHKVTTSELIAGDYFVEVLAVPFATAGGGGGRDLSATAERSFAIRWRGMPASIVDLDLALDQLQYLTDKDKIDEMKKQPQEKKQEMFRDFWKKKDPTPNTERNEIMEEYYARVTYANKHFGHYVDGWKTDMGMVYIIFGSPSNIERHPFDSDAKPYEVWTYYELNREFIFVDATGFGDYRLQNPIWDLNRTRPR